MKQTAVEWLVEQLKKSLPSVYNGEFNKEIEQANKMFEQQIIDAVYDAQRTDFYVKYYDAEQYYNETFNK